MCIETQVVLKCKIEKDFVNMVAPIQQSLETKLRI